MGNILVAVVALAALSAAPGARADATPVVDAIDDLVLTRQADMARCERLADAALRVSCMQAAITRFNDGWLARTRKGQ